MCRLILLLALALALGQGASAQDWGRWQIVNSTATTSDSSSSGTTNVAGLSFKIIASQTLLAHCYVVTHTAISTTAPRISVTGPASPTAVTAALKTASADTTILTEQFNAFTFVSASATSAGATLVVNQLDLLIRNGSTAGTVQVTINTSVNSSSVTADIGSWCEYTYE